MDVLYALACAGRWDSGAFPFAEAVRAAATELIAQRVSTLFAAGLPDVFLQARPLLLPLPSMSRRERQQTNKKEAASICGAQLESIAARARFVGPSGRGRKWIPSPRPVCLSLPAIVVVAAVVPVRCRLVSSPSFVPPSSPRCRHPSHSATSCHTRSLSVFSTSPPRLLPADALRVHLPGQTRSLPL